MTCSSRLSQWSEEVSRHFPSLSRPQARVLALWSFGMVFAHACGLSQISALVALLLDVPEGNVRQRLREWLYGAQDKRGKKRREVQVGDCFGPLLRWVLEHWPQGERRVALALDATTLGQRFTVLAISVLVRGCAIPVAWKVLPYNQKGSWQPHWNGLLEALRGSIPAEWEVLVLADRGLYARWLYQKIVAVGWHPMLRINLAAKARLDEHHPFVWIKQWMPPMGEQWAGQVECFAQKQSRLCCTLVLCQQEGYEEPWVIVTDLLPHQVQGAWYRMRYWIEGGFKDFKRGGWGWQHTKMLDAQRAERLWLAMAVATLCTVAVGGAAELQPPTPSRKELPPTHVARVSAGSGHGPKRGRELSCLTRGRLTLLAAVLRDEPLPQGCLEPEAWATTLPPARKPSAAAKLKEQQRLKQRERQRVKRRRRKAAHRKGKGKGKKAA